MQLITNLWKSGIKGKGLILAVPVMLFCLTCVGISSLISDATPPTPTVDPNAIQTTIAETAAALVAINNPTFTLEPTFTSAPTFTDIPITEYPQVAAVRFQSLEQAVNELIPMHQAFISDMSLAKNIEWYSSMSATLLRVETGASQLAAMKNIPPEYEPFYQVLLQIEQRTKLASPEYKKALDQLDVEALNRATQYFGEIITYVNQARGELTTINTPPTLAPTQTPLPTATVVVIIPTAVPQQSNCLAAYPDFCIQRDPRKNCDQLPSNFTVLPPDPLRYDRDNDGIGCEG